MKRKDIDRMLKNLPAYNAYIFEVIRIDFAKAMHGRQYGYEALSDAFVWYLQGYLDACKIDSTEVRK